ncbi:hypothetical protein CEXT_412731 [Caerostris extrusa]|uniref:Uncharacterized protein n=1 Tax=Caerostris extrusa TaxID=172846 RepID=A0AAV4XVH7_CAEEX|nr:hypothetical protein CEXT_412731 [Caerostris extrusa]
MFRYITAAQNSGSDMTGRLHFLARFSGIIWMLVMKNTSLIMVQLFLADRISTFVTFRFLIMTTYEAIYLLSPGTIWSSDHAKRRLTICCRLVC